MAHCLSPKRPTSLQNLNIWKNVTKHKEKLPTLATNLLKCNTVFKSKNGFNLDTGCNNVLPWLQIRGYDLLGRHSVSWEAETGWMTICGLIVRAEGYSRHTEGGSWYGSQRAYISKCLATIMTATVATILSTVRRAAWLKNVSVWDTMVVWSRSTGNALRYLHLISVRISKHKWHCTMYWCRPMWLL